jgi:hypothetical protein
LTTDPVTSPVLWVQGKSQRVQINDLL